MAAAALVVLVLGGWWLGLATRASTVVLAAQLTADHSKCFFIARDVGTLASRRCLSGEGTNAHLLYAWQGESVSLYMLPSDRRSPTSLELFGHHTEVWSGHNESYVLVTRASGRDLTGLSATCSTPPNERARGGRWSISFAGSWPRQR